MRRAGTADTEATPADDERGLAPGVDLGPEAGAILLGIARRVVSCTAAGEPVPLRELLPPDPPRVLLEPRAAFVTLREGDDLRGCVGSLATDVPLWRTVADAAVSASASDPRFRPVTPDEVPRLTIDVSVLGPPIPLRGIEAFRPGVDGLIVERGMWRGLLLPEVATDQGWGAVEMLGGTCWKAGLPSDAWRDPRTTVLAFRTARVSERDLVPA